MKAAPRVAIGCTLYNNAPHLPEAVESLLSQTYRDFTLILSDDASTDETPRLLAEYAAIDDRIVIHRNPRRLGMIRNWRRAFEVAQERAGPLDYFAWASDHDIWHPRWLAALLDTLERTPEAVVAYPLNIRIDENGRQVRGPWRFDTAGITDRGRRFWQALRGMSAGNIVYGLMRADRVAQAGIFRDAMIPDRLLLAEMALYGEFRQVPEILWFRRIGGPVTLERQRRSFYPDGAPLAAHLPWWLTHTGVLVWNLGLRGTGRPDLGRWAGLRHGLAYLPPSLIAEIRRQFNVDITNRDEIVWYWKKRFARTSLGKFLGARNAQEWAEVRERKLQERRSRGLRGRPNQETNESVRVPEGLDFESVN